MAIVVIYVCYGVNGIHGLLSVYKDEMGWPFLVWLEIAFDGNSCYIRLLWGEWYSWVALGNSSYNLIHSSQLSHNTRIKNPDSEEKKSWPTTLSVRNASYNLIHSSQLSHNTRIKNPDSEEKKSWPTTLSVRNVTAIPYFQVSPFGKLAVSLSTRANPESIVFRSGTDLLRINPLCGIRPSLFSETDPISSPRVLPELSRGLLCWFEYCYR